MKEVICNKTKICKYSCMHSALHNEIEQCVTPKCRFYKNAKCIDTGFIKRFEPIILCIGAFILGLIIGIIFIFI